MVPRTDIPRTVAELLNMGLSTTPDAEALVGRHARYTFAQLDEIVHAATLALEGLGVTTGVCVAASATNCVELVVAFLATMRLGAIWVGIASQLAGPEKIYQLKDCGGTVFLADRRAAGQVAEQRRELPDLANIVVMDPDEPNGEWAQLIAGYKGARAPMRSIDPFAPAAIGYTSGTSGYPKGVLHSQHNIMVVAITTLGGARGDQGPPTLRRGATIPLTVLNVMVLTAVVTLAGGGCLVCVDRRDARGIAEWIKAERVGHVHLSGAHLHDMLNNGTTREELESLLFVNNAGAGIALKLREDFDQAFGIRSLTSYGLTEGLAGATGFPVGAPFIDGSSGTVNRHLELSIQNANGEALEHGAVGEICIRAVQEGLWADLYRPMLGYWNKPEASAQVLRDGWLHSGDLGRLDDNGHLFISGRLSEVILRGGANVYPAEIERVLQGDPFVRDVAVIGKPDERLGEEVVAFIELKPGGNPEQMLPILQQRCAHELARYKWPSEWRFVDTLPRNAMNKVIKPAVKLLL